MVAFAHPTHACPKCGAACEQTGEFDWQGETFPVFQCDACEVPWVVEGETFPTVLTFSVDASGNAFDPASPEKPAWLSPPPAP